MAAVGVVAGLALGACTGESEGSPPRGTQAKTEAPVTTTTVVPLARTLRPEPALPATATTLRPTRTPTPDGEPVYDANGLPQVTASPRKGGVGATIHVDGYGFTDPHWQDAGSTLWLSGGNGDPGCLVYAEAEHTIEVTADGRLHGDFAVPARGSCRQSGVSEFPLDPGTYSIVYQCTVCTIGTFEVTGSAPAPSAECTTVGFTPQTEDAASSIVATGITCEEAEAFLRRLGPSVSPNGPARIELEGFECFLTRHQEEPLPQGFYECRRGSERITFVRS